MRYWQRLDKLEERMTPKEPEHMTVNLYMSEETEPLRLQHNLPENMNYWPAEVVALLTPFSVMRCVL